MARKEKKYHYIYKTVDTRNGKFYIGMHSTNDLNDGYVGSGDRVRKIKHRHGKDFLKLEILEFLPDRESLKKREEEIVNSDLINEEKCMNLRVGGEGGLKDDEHAYKFHSAGGRSVRKIMREQHLDKFNNDSEYREKWFNNYRKAIKEKCTGENNHFYGKKHSVETKKKISEEMKIHQKGKNNSQYGTMWVSNGEICKKIKKTDIIPEGWRRGRK